ncbi:MAG: T9SS type A sorting domain-containing protein [Ignavibacteria bacterium]|nr:T9SS type A sorting domain-containing protein [Ignavibacteria bacterium]
MKFDRFGDTIWTRTFNNSDYNRDDVATDILVDGNFVYAIGYTYNGEGFKNDIILYTCELDGTNARTEIVNRKFTNETPTAFIFAKIVDAPPLQKSRTAVVVVTDRPFGQGGNNFLTYYFKDNNTSSLYWMRDFAGGENTVSIPTSIAADPQGNVYVTGYTNLNGGSGYDFVSMKYNKDDGSYGWNSPSVLFYDSLNGNDKASSIKVKNNRIYIAGSSDSTQNGYYVAAYNQVQGYPHKDFDNVFVPSFSRNGAVNQNVKRAAVIELDSSGNTYLIAQSWNETQAYYAIRKYDQQGNVIHTIDPYEHLFGGSESDNTTSQLQTTEEITLLGNYPNPFNPVTNIRYDLQQDNFVTIRVYDVLGKEVVTLVNQNKQAGKYLISFKGTGLSSGIYLYKIKAGEYEHTRRMTLLK